MGSCILGEFLCGSAKYILKGIRLVGLVVRLFVYAMSVFRWLASTTAYPLYQPWSAVEYIWDVFEMWCTLVVAVFGAYRRVFADYRSFVLRLFLVLSVFTVGVGDWCGLFIDLPMHFVTFCRNFSLRNFQHLAYLVVCVCVFAVPPFILLTFLGVFFVGVFVTVLLFVHHWILSPSGVQKFFLLVMHAMVMRVYQTCFELGVSVYTTTMTRTVLAIFDFWEEFFERVFTSVNMARRVRSEFWRRKLFGAPDVRRWIFPYKFTMSEMFWHPFATRVFELPNPQAPRRTYELLSVFGVAVRHEPEFALFGAFVALPLVEYQVVLDDDDDCLYGHWWRVVVVRVSDTMAGYALHITAASDPLAFQFDVEDDRVPRGLLCSWAGEVCCFFIAEWHVEYTSGGALIPLYAPPSAAIYPHPDYVHYERPHSPDVFVLDISDEDYDASRDSSAPSDHPDEESLSFTQRRYLREYRADMKRHHPLLGCTDPSLAKSLEDLRHSRIMRRLNLKTRYYEDVCEDCLCDLFFEPDPFVDSDDDVEHFHVAAGKDTDVVFDAFDGLLSALDKSVLLLTDTGVDAVEAVRFLGVVTNIAHSRANPVATASVLVAAYPKICVEATRSLLTRAECAGMHMRDLIAAMVTDDEPVEALTGTELASVGSGDEYHAASAPAMPTATPNSFAAMAKSLRKEFVGRLMLDELLKSFITPGSTLAFWVGKLSPFGDGSIMNFFEGLIASCIRVFAHVRYYFDGDLPKYLSSLDAESAAVYRFSCMELYLTENGYDETFLAWIDAEIPAFEKLLPRLITNRPSFQQMTASLSTLRLWRGQCYAKLNDGNLPFVLMVAGIERSGKSEFMELLKILPAVYRKVPVGTINVSRPRPSDAFDTEISPATDIVLFQDSFKDAVPAMRRDMLNLLFDLAGGQCIPLTKAKLEEKGTYAAPPSIIMISSNDESMRLDSQGDVFTNHVALAARSQYGMWCTWTNERGEELNSDLDPHREHVRWYVGAYSKENYKKGRSVKPYVVDASKPWCGGPMTFVEAMDKLQIAYDAHQVAIEEYAAVRKARSMQCMQCFRYTSNCICVQHAISGPLEIDLALSFGSVGYLLWTYAFVRVAEYCAYYALMIYTWYGAYTKADQLLVWFQSRWNTFSDYQQQRMTLVKDYVEKLPSYVKSAKAQFERLEVLRSMRKAFPIAVVGVMIVGAAFWKWRQTRAASVMVAASDIVHPPSEKRAKVVMPGVVVTNLMETEKVCGRCVAADGAQNFVRYDEHTILTVSHLVAGPLAAPSDLTITRPLDVPYKDKLVPELCTIDRQRDMMLICTPKRLKFVGPKPLVGKYDRSGAMYYISGYHGEDKCMYRAEVGVPQFGNVPMAYDDPRTKEWYHVLPGEYVSIPIPYQPGSCGSIFHDGVAIYGIVVASNAKNTCVRLFPEGGVEGIRGSSFGPLPPPAMMSLERSFIARGMDPDELHPMSSFNKPDVREHWDYRLTVKDSAHMRPRARRVYGPHVSEIQALSGVPCSNLLESTGASGTVEGVDHKVSPMEHFFEKHKVAQAKGSPILDEDPLPEVNTYVEHCLKEMSIRWTRPLTTEVALYGDEVIKPMAMDKSAGYPECQKRELMSRGPQNEILAGPALVAALDTAYTDFLKGECKPGIFRPFPKQGEILPAAKVRAGMSRIIMNHLGFVQSVVIRRLMLPVLLNIIAARSQFGILVGLSATNPEHVAALARDVHFGDPNVASMDGDHRTLDLNQRPRIAGMVFSVMYGVAVKMGYSDEELRAVRYCFYLWLYPNFVYRGDVWTAEANIWGSGSLGTEVFQSLSTWLLHLIATIVFIRRRENAPVAPAAMVVAEQDRAGARVYGDDNHRNHYSDSISGELLASCASGCGYTLTDNHDKSKPPMPTKALSILKRTIARVDYDGTPDLTMPLEIASIVKSLYWPLKGLDGKCDRGIYANSLINANREIFLHGPDTFNKWHPVLVKCWTDLGVVSAGPSDWPELLLKYRSGVLETWDSGGQLPI